MCTVFTNKQNHTRNPPKRNQLSTHNLPKRHQPFHAQSPNDIKRPMRNPPNDINRPTRNPPNETNCPHVIRPNETVGAVPVCPPERPRSGVSMLKVHTWCAGFLTMDAPLWGDTGGHTGTAPTNLNQPHVVCHYPIGVIHLHIGGGNASRTPAPIT